jgi:ATP-dependent helicase/nuclease subunit B
MARGGGFVGVPAMPVGELAYWRLSGGRRAGEICPVKADPHALADQALAHLERLVARFDDPKMPYPARPRPEWALRFNDYAHLAREKAWATSEGEDEA